ncbi:MAG: YitT family protein [Christensenellaceae bacterium]|nr:YitT family protein [Christensenellaceae bacterium]MDD6926274.1 YitT family protein [bacterium]MDY2851046.1 YitT family protein [Christensenellaceae bacterium]
MKNIKDYLLLTLGSLLLAVGVYFFKIPNGFAMGGVAGLATLLGELFDKLNPSQEWLKAVLKFLTPSTMITIFNILLLIVGFIFVNKQFGIKTVYCTLVYSLFTMLLEAIYPMKTIGETGEIIKITLTKQPFMELVIAIILTALGSAIMFNKDASSGGTDIIAMILKKYTEINVGMALLFADGLIALSSFFVSGIETGLFSVLGLTMKSFMVDEFIDNLNLCKYFTIVTEKPDEICEFIMNTMHRSATTLTGEGAFSHHTKKVILVVCKRYEMRTLRSKIKEIDPSAFIMITNSSEILGKGFAKL